MQLTQFLVYSKPSGYINYFMANNSNKYVNAIIVFVSIKLVLIINEILPKSLN